MARPIGMTLQGKKEIGSSHLVFEEIAPVSLPNLERKDSNR
jgi:hypothetical protein